MVTWIAKPFILPLQMFGNVYGAYVFFDFCYKSLMNMRASEGHWRLPSSPIVKNMWCPYVNWQSARTICFSDKKFWASCMEDMFVDFCYKSRMKIAASEIHWRLPSPPIVERICVCSRRSGREDDDDDENRRRQ